MQNCASRGFSGLFSANTEVGWSSCPVSAVGSYDHLRSPNYLCRFLHSWLNSKNKHQPNQKKRIQIPPSTRGVRWRDNSISLFKHIYFSASFFSLVSLFRFFIKVQRQHQRLQLKLERRTELQLGAVSLLTKYPSKS